jgi:hypothetical protein
MSSFIILKVRLGPLVSLELTGENCKEISEALEGFERLNRQIEAMCNDLAERAYPAAEAEAPSDQEAQR